MEPQTNTLAIGGARKSPIDYRQIKLEHIAGAAPEVTAPLNIMIDYSKIPALFQRQIGACQNHAFVEILMHRELRLTGAVTLLSPRFPYTMCKVEDGIPVDQDQGTYTNMPFKMAVKYGVASDAVVPNDTTLGIDAYVYNLTVAQMPPEAFTDADKHRIPGYVQVGSTDNVTLADLAQALQREPDGVEIQIALGTEFYTSQYGIVIPKGQSSWARADITPIAKCVSPIDDHDITVTGLQTDAASGRTKVFFRNHWSTSWSSTSGDLGGTRPVDTDGGDSWFWFDDHTIVEAWIPSEIPDALLALVKSLPNAADFHHTFTKDLTPGMTDPDVMQLQIALKIIGTFPFNQSVTTYFGKNTAEAVMAWQTQENVATPAQIAAAAGSVGPKSLATLNKMFAHQ